MAYRPNSGSFKKGFAPGRPKGVKNKFTTLKAAFVNAFVALGGEEGLIQWMTEVLEIKDKKGRVIQTVDLSGDRKKEFFKMIASMLPKDSDVSRDPPGLLEEEIEIVPADSQDTNRVKKYLGN